MELIVRKAHHETLSPKTHQASPVQSIEELFLPRNARFRTGLHQLVQLRFLAQQSGDFEEGKRLIDVVAKHLPQATSPKIHHVTWQIEFVSFSQDEALI